MTKSQNILIGNGWPSITPFFLFFLFPLFCGGEEKGKNTSFDRSFVNGWYYSLTFAAAFEFKAKKSWTVAQKPPKLYVQRADCTCKTSQSSSFNHLANEKYSFGKKAEVKWTWPSSFKDYYYNLNWVAFWCPSSLLPCSQIQQMLCGKPHVIVQTTRRSRDRKVSQCTENIWGEKRNICATSNLDSIFTKNKWR